MKTGATHTAFVDSLTAELMAMSDEEVPDGQDPAEEQARGRALVARAKRTALIRRVVRSLDEQGYRGLEWRYHDGKVQVGSIVTTELFDGIRYHHGRPFRVWADVPSLARVLAVKRFQEREAERDPDIPF